MCIHIHAYRPLRPRQPAASPASAACPASAGTSASRPAP